MAPVGINRERQPAAAHGPWNAESAVSGLFFLSGAAGLIFEIVWFHRCGLVFGNTVAAATIVLSSFMGGLALGNVLVAWWGHRIARLLRAYALLEAAVAVAGVALASGLVPLTHAISRVAGLGLQENWTGTTIRLVAVFLLLCVPSSAMGATLPVVVAAMSRSRRGFGAALGRLYGWNTLGAVTGIVAAEIVLIDRFGVTGSAWVAALLDLVAAVSALWLSSRVDETRPVETRASVRPSARGWALLSCAGLAGATLVGLEVVWFRFLSLYVITTSLALNLMLAMVLAGIAIGGLCMSEWIKRSRDVVRHLPAVALLAGAGVAGSYAGFQAVTTGTQVVEWERILWFTAALTFPASFLSAMLFTLLGEALAGDVPARTAAAGWLTFANTAGAACGPALVTFLALPLFGLERAFFAATLAYGVIALLAIWATAGRARPARMARLSAAIAFLLAVALFPFGLMQEGYFARAAEPYARDGSEIVATREGPAETIFLMQQKWLQQPVYSRLVTNGFSMSGTTLAARRYMRYFAYWPAVLHKAPLRRVLVICFGVGVTVAAVEDIPSVEAIDVVEISRDIVATSDAIYAPDRHPLHDPRVRLHLEDGRYFLQNTDNRYDLITGEPPPPRTGSAVNIYTREYFQLIRDRLAEGGMTTYWLPVARPDPGTDVNAIIRAFCEVFDDCSLWNGTPEDLMLVGSRHAAGPLSPAEFARAWEDSRLGAGLREMGFEAAGQIGATFVGDAAFLRALSAATPPLTDDFPHRLRPVAGRPSMSDPRQRTDPAVLAQYRAIIDPERTRQAFVSSEFVKQLWPPALVEQTLPFFRYQRTINRVLWEGGDPLRQIEDLHAVLSETSLQTLPLWLLGSDDVRQRIAAAAPDDTMQLRFMRGIRALATRDLPLAASFFQRSDRPLLVYTLCLAGQREAAVRLARRVDPRDDAERHFWEWLKTAFDVAPVDAN